MISILDYGVGNTLSVKKAIERFGKASLTSDIRQLREADGIVLPGVGAFETAMSNIRPFESLLKETGVPILGICLGMQLLLSESEEGGRFEGLDMIQGKVKRFPPILKVPQVGWNTVEVKSDARLFDGIPDNSYFYFVHSYYCDPREGTVGTTDYGIEYCSAIEKDNLFGTQFHPEKSSVQGLGLLKNFVEVCRR